MPRVSNAERPSRRLLRLAALAGAVLGLVTWPMACRYTSFGLDLERAEGAQVRQTFWRLRWPGDGSVALVWIAEHRDLAAGAVEPWDLGGAFLEPAPRLAASGFWQDHGFWWVDADAASGAVPGIVGGADRAVLVGVPHGLVALLLALGAAWLRRGRVRA